MSNIPEARAKLLVIARSLENRRMGSVAQDIRAVVEDHLFRESPVRRSPRKSARVTPAMAAGIKSYALTNPDASYMQIASRWGVSIGRVSEILTGN